MNKKKNLSIRAKSIQKKPFYWAFHQVSFLMAFFPSHPFPIFFSRVFFEILRAFKITITFLSFFLLLSNDRTMINCIARQLQKDTANIMRVFSTNDKVLLKKKILPSPIPPKKTSIVTPKLLPKKTTAIYNMTNEIKEKEKIMMK